MNDSLATTKMSRSVQRFSLHLTVLLCIATVACSGFVKSVSDLVVVQGALAKEFNEQNVKVVNNNSRYLVITFTNSPLNDGDWTVRAKRAQAAAILVKQRYPDIAQINEIWIHFVRQETRYLVVNYFETLEVYAFDRNAQFLPKGENTKTQYQPQTILRYQQREDLTEVSVNNLQLEGTPENGLTIIPHFKLSGDANSVKGPPPEAVGVDVAYISRLDRFPAETKVQIVIDDHVAFRGKGKFHGSQSPDGVYSKFLSLKLTYLQFRRICDGTEVMIRLDDYGYSLTEEHLNALRDMRSHVQE